MPQLDLAPWFIILVLSWSIFLLSFTMKIKHINLTKNPVSTSSSTPKTNFWFWLWT